jgi:hypothetical protein
MFPIGLDFLIKVAYLFWETNVYQLLICNWSCYYESDEMCKSFMLAKLSCWARWDLRLKGQNWGLHIYSLELYLIIFLGFSMWKGSNLFLFKCQKPSYIVFYHSLEWDPICGSCDNNGTSYEWMKFLGWA